MIGDIVLKKSNLRRKSFLSKVDVICNKNVVNYRVKNNMPSDRYLQHEAISAQERMAGSPNHTQIYIPVGTNGIPLVKTIE